MQAIIKNVLKDENGTATIEYAFVMGLIVLAAMSVIGAFGAKVVGKWTSLNSSFH